MLYLGYCETKSFNAHGSTSAVADQTCLCLMVLSSGVCRGSRPRTRAPIFLLFSFLPLFVEMRCKSIQAPEQQHTYIFKRYYNSCEDVAVSLSRTVLTSATGKIILGIGVDVTSVLISFVCFGRAIPFTTGQAATLEVSRSKVALQLVWCDNTAYQLRGVGPFLARTPTSKTIVTKDQP